MNASDVEAFLWDLSAPDAASEETPPVSDKGAAEQARGLLQLRLNAQCRHMQCVCLQTRKFSLTTRLGCRAGSASSCASAWASSDNALRCET